MHNDFDELADQFRQQGHKLTQPRRAILLALMDASKPLSPADIQEQGQVFCSDLGLVTVYRTLELMEQMDIVRAVHLAEGCHGYVLVTPGHSHHIVCERCHAVVEVIGCNLDEFLRSVAERTGYSVTGHWLEISGLCEVCRRTPAP